MTLIKRSEIGALLPAIAAQGGPRIFLFFGERFLCRQAVEELESFLLHDRGATIHAIDGDQEDASLTLAKLMSFSLLPGMQVFRVSDTRLFLSKNVGGNVWQKACEAHKANRPQLAARYLGELYALAAQATSERQPLAQLSDEQWRSLFGLAKPVELDWTEGYFAELAHKSAATSSAADLADNYLHSFKKGLPPNNLLILTAESVDRRKRLFSFIKETGVIVDCSVAEGGGAAAQRAQKAVLLEMMQQTLAVFDKTIDPGAVDIFFDRVGFHPVAVVTETEKLALYTGERARITLDDLDRMVAKTREDALFELTDHFGRRNVGKCLSTLANLLDNGVHGLAILATLRNYVRKLLVFKSLQLQPDPPYQRGMNAKHFQDNYLPRLKETCQYADMLGGHPYALFMSFTKAGEYTCATLKTWLEQILLAEYRLKGSGLPDHILLEQLIIAMLSATSPDACARSGI